jgi:Phage integrase family
MTLRSFADLWRGRRGYQLVRPRENDYRLDLVCSFVPEAYVFGNRLGGRSTSIRTAWNKARQAAGLAGFQLRDLRHEAASRFEEAGVLTTDVSRFLGHRSLSTTTRYLKTTSRRLRMALLRVEQARGNADGLANSCKEPSESSPRADDAPASSLPSKSLNGRDYRALRLGLSKVEGLAQDIRPGRDSGLP